MLYDALQYQGKPSTEALGLAHVVLDPHDASKLSQKIEEAQAKSCPLITNYTSHDNDRKQDIREHDKATVHEWMDEFGANVIDTIRNAGLLAGAYQIPTTFGLLEDLRQGKTKEFRRVNDVLADGLLDRLAFGCGSFYMPKAWHDGGYHWKLPKAIETFANECDRLNVWPLPFVSPEVSGDGDPLPPHVFFDIVQAAKDHCGGAVLWSRQTKTWGMSGSVMGAL